MANTQRVVVTGATGLIGKAVCKQLMAKGYQVVIFSRNPESARAALPGAAEYVVWQPSASGAWAVALDGAYGVIHLAGAPIVSKRWTEAYKREILDSRVVGTHGIVNAMKAARQKPQVFVCASAVGYYGAHGDEVIDESVGPGSDFLANVVKAWEAEAAKAEDAGIRTVMIRTGIVLDKREGALKQLLLPFSLFVGGPILPGTQWWPWIHVDDEAGIILLALEDARVRGPVNTSAPNPQTTREFANTLGKVMGRPALFPVPGFALQLLLGEVASMLTAGQRTVPTKALALGYQFKYPTSEQALRELLR